MNCERCPLSGQTIVYGEGPPDARIALVGEAPGYQESLSGKPFRGPAGSELDKFLVLAGLKRGDLLVTNIVACRPPGNRAPTPEEREACRSRLTGELAGRTTVILLGATAVGEFLPDIPLARYHGIPHRRGSITYAPMYHPAAGLHQPGLRATIAEDWRSLTARLDRLPAIVQTRYLKLDRWTGIGTVALDTETDSGKMVAVSVSDEAGQAVCLPSAENLSLGFATTILMHNAKFDLKVLREEGLDLVPRIGKSPAYFLGLADTMIAAYLCGEPQLGLKVLALKRLGIEMVRLPTLLEETQELLLQEYLERASGVLLSRSLFKSLQAVLAAPNRATALARRHALRKEIGQPPIAGVRDVARLLPTRFRDYSCADADMTRRLWPGLQVEMEQKGVGKLFREVEMPLVGVLVGMEERGILIDRERAEIVRDDFTHKADALACCLHDTLGLGNPASRDEVARVLYEVIGCPVLGYTDGGKPTTARWALEALSETEPYVGDILQYRRYAKLIGTYLEPWLATSGRIHADFNQVRQVSDDEAWGATATGRLSSSGPNFQNVPARTPEGQAVRSCIIAAPGKRLVSIDDRQIELVLMAIDANDSEMIEAFRSGKDIHTETAALIYGHSDITKEERYVGKTINFAWGYGIRANALSRTLTLNGIPTTREQAQGLLNTFEAHRPRLKARWLEVVAQAKEDGFATTLWGRRRYLPALSLATSFEEEYEAGKQAYSHHIQGTAADISKVALIVLDNLLPDTLICAVHDERLLETDLPPDQICKAVAAALHEIRKWPLPNSDLLAMSIKSGPNWAEMEAK